MKKIYISFFIALATLLFASCTNGYDGMNMPDTGLTDPEGERDAYFLGQHFNVMQQSVLAQDAAQSQFAEQLMGGSYGGYFADVRPFSAPYSTYAPESGWTETSFNFATGNPMASYRKIKTMTTDPILLNVSKVLKVMILSKITDTYGPIPYASLEEDGQLTASYDPQDVVYKDMIADLDEAIELFTANRSESFSSNADLYYNGKVENWAKLANSMKLRLAIRMANIEPALAKKIAEEVAANPVGTMSTNADNANLPILAGQTNPYEVGMVEWNGGDSRISADITSYMNGYKDPRRSAYFDPTKIAGYEKDYIGYRNGVDIANQKIAQTYSNIGTAFLEKTSYVIMAASEVAFLKAEGALRGWAMGGTAKEFYEQGITLSFDQWSVSGADAYIGDETSKVSPYVDPRGAFSFTGTPSAITIAWEDSATESTKMERIITQKWIALFPNGIESWSEFRRTGFPKLMPVLKNRSTVVSEERMARRLEFPQSEYTGNGVNVAKAVTYLGGTDNMATDLWWAKKN